MGHLTGRFLFVWHFSLFHGLNGPFPRVNVPFSDLNGAFPRSRPLFEQPIKKGAFRGS